ncbi:MAG: CvpA family protein [Chthoniobacterales bacterium]
MNADLVSGSPLWQTVFVSFAVLLLLFQIIRGWRLGLPRQLVRIGAIVAAYSAALLGGSLLLPILRPLLRVPDFVITAVGGIVLALIVYSVVNMAGTILFKRTGQQSSGLVRMVYGISGAVLGIFFGLFFIWMLLMGVRSLGAIGEAQVSAQNSSTPSPVVTNTRGRRRASLPPPPVDENSIAFTMARLKKSIELGPLGNAVKQTDVMPGGIYDTLTKVGQVFARPESAQRFMSYPGVAELTDDPKILALRADPEITQMLEQGRLWDLLRDEHLIAAVNDPALKERLKKFDLRKALDYAAREN